MVLHPIGTSIDQNHTHAPDETERGECYAIFAGLYWPKWCRIIMDSLRVTDDTMLRTIHVWYMHLQLP